MIRSMLASLVGFSLLSITACASTPGAQPHDMSAAGHAAMAAGEDRSAAAHASQYDPAASRERAGRCAGSPGTVADVCWSSVTNPTTEHLKEAERHRKMAADHRAASQALKDAEARACAGITELDRDMSPFSHREDISKVETLTTTVASSNSVASSKPSSRVRGAAIVFRAVPGMTAQWLQRVVDCHMARNAALGHDLPEMLYCPLVPKGVTAKVTTRESELAVEVTSDDANVAAEIVRRAQALVKR